MAASPVTPLTLAATNLHGDEGHPQRACDKVSRPSPDLPPDSYQRCCLPWVPDTELQETSMSA